jgi:hypothetical protein
MLGVNEKLGYRPAGSTLRWSRYGRFVSRGGGTGPGTLSGGRSW